MELRIAIKIIYHPSAPREAVARSERKRVAARFDIR